MPGVRRCRATDPRTPALGIALRRGGLRVGTHEHGVGDFDDLVGGEIGPLGVFADRLGARGLVDADGADGAAALVEDVAANPADVVRHLLVANLGRPPSGLLKLGGRLPAAAPQNYVGIHRSPLLSVTLPSIRPRRPPGSKIFPTGTDQCLRPCFRCGARCNVTERCTVFGVPPFGVKVTRNFTGARSVFFNRLARRTRAWSVSHIDCTPFDLRVTACTFLPNRSTNPALCSFTWMRTVPLRRLWTMRPKRKLLD